MSSAYVRVVALLVVVLGGAGVAAGDIISLTGGSLASLSVRGDNNAVDFAPAAVTLPSSGTLTLNKPGVVASVDYSFTSSGFSFSNANFSEAAAGGVSSFADAVATVDFTPNVPVNYTIAGALNWTGNWGNGVTLFAHLQDVTDPGSPINIANHFYTKSGVLTSAALAVAAGAGKPTTGTLLPGHVYQVDFELAADNNRFSPETGTASGYVSCVFTPEPGTLGLIAMGLLGSVRRRR